MKNLFLLAALLCSIVIAAQETVLYVAAKRALNIRDKPETSVSVLDKIPYAAKVSLQESNEVSKEINTEGFIGY